MRAGAEWCNLLDEALNKPNEDTMCTWAEMVGCAYRHKLTGIDPPRVVYANLTKLCSPTATMLELAAAVKTRLHSDGALAASAKHHWEPPRIAEYGAVATGMVEKYKRVHTNEDGTAVSAQLHVLPCACAQCQAHASLVLLCIGGPAVVNVISARTQVTLCGIRF